MAQCVIFIKIIHWAIKYITGVTEIKCCSFKKVGSVSEILATSVDTISSARLTGLPGRRHKCGNTGRTIKSL